MFDVTLVDHLRLNFGHVVHSYQAHTELANRFARRVRALQLLLAAIMALAASAAVAAASGGPGPFALIAATSACVALALFIVQIALNLEPAILAHRSAAVRIWLVREKYRALLSDLNDGHVDPVEVRARRDGLITELHAIYENVPPTDQKAFDRARKALAASGAQTLGDDEVDRFLPKALRKTTA
jgi:hypothetical protein